VVKVSVEAAGRKAYMCESALLIMGSGEATVLFNYLRSRGALTARTARDYVLRALYDSDLMVSTDPFIDLRLRVEGEVMYGTTTDEQPLSDEAADYLRGLLGTISGRGPGLDEGSAYDGFSPEAYEELREVLGEDGLERLSISGGLSLEPAPEVRKDLQVRQYAARMRLLVARAHARQQSKGSWAVDEPRLGPPPSIFEQGDPPPAFRGYRGYASE